MTGGTDDAATVEGNVLDYDSVADCTYLGVVFEFLNSREAQNLASQIQHLANCVDTRYTACDSEEETDACDNLKSILHFLLLTLLL